MTVAKHAQENGMPEPPKIFFETQDRIIDFFRKHGDFRLYNPRQVILEPGDELLHMMVVEEGSVAAEKDIVIMRDVVNGPRIHGETRLARSMSPRGDTETSEVILNKHREMRAFKQSANQRSTRASGCREYADSAGESHRSGAAATSCGGIRKSRDISYCSHEHEAAPKDTQESSSSFSQPLSVASISHCRLASAGHRHTIAEPAPDLTMKASPLPPFSAGAPRFSSVPDSSHGHSGRDGNRGQGLNVLRGISLEGPSGTGPQAIEKLRLSTLEQDELLCEVPFIEGTPLEVRYVADVEGAAIRVLPRSMFVQELESDPSFAGNVFKNIAITLSVRQRAGAAQAYAPIYGRCEEICWQLEEMAIEASSMAWRAPWRTDARSKHRQKFAVSHREGKRLQQLLGLPLDEVLMHSTTAAFDTSMRVHGHLLVFSECLAFYAKVFGMTVKKLLPVARIVAVLRDTPSTKDVDSAIEVACIEDTIIFSAIPDMAETGEAINEALQFAKKKRRGSSTQVMEINSKAREAARQALETTSFTVARSFDQRFQLTADDWLDFLQREAQSFIYTKGETILAQREETDSLFQIARGCVRLEKLTQLGDGTVVISRLGPPAVFGEFFFLMDTRTPSLTSFISDMDGTELYIIKPSSLLPYLTSKPMMPVCLYKYLAASMARKYRVLSATAGFGLVRSGEDAVHVPLEEVFSNPVFVSFFARYLRTSHPDKKPWLQFYQQVEEYRVLPRGSFSNKAARSISAQFVSNGARFAVPISSHQQESIRLSQSTQADTMGNEILLRNDLFDMAQLEVFEELKAHTYDKFISSSFFSGIAELKLREKEVPTVHHFYYLKRLGVGSFGEVFAVRKKDSHKKYALKVMSKQSQAKMSKRWAMYLRVESDVMASLSHPFLVNLNYSFQTPDAAFMVLDLVVGGDLNAFQQRFKDVPPTEEMLRFMAAELVAGIEYLHASCIIHRDIKPPNVLLDEEGHIRITDFGLSLFLNHGETLYDRTGTKPYMAPELHLASKSHRRGYSFSVDWFALGVTLWEVTSGGTADPNTVQAVLQVIKSGQKLAPEHFNEFTMDVFTGSAERYMAHLSPEAHDFFASLLSREPSKRLGDGTIRDHPIFAEVNWTALVTRRYPVPWCRDVLRELQSNSVVEGLEERKTAAHALCGIPATGPRLDRVENFDFVSPRAVMEEYMENIYQLRHDDGS